SLQAVQWLAAGRDWAPDDGRLDAVRNAYLAEWGDPPALRPVAYAAVRLACVSRALSWHRALRDASSDIHAKWDNPVTGWLEELLPPVP
ncbi:MAG: hypothetical protein ACRD0W_17205, partial [Acidimicrobiales bacterium]